MWSTVLRRSWRSVMAVVLPLVLMPLLFDFDNKARLCAYVLLLMVFFWIFEAINLYATALIPVALFPLFGILSSDATCSNYMKATNMMFIGGLIMGIALEYSNLHKRIALKVIIYFGSSIKNLLAGVMLVTMALSMWINNTATTAMMIPIVDSILVELYSFDQFKTQEVRVNVGVARTSVRLSQIHVQEDEPNIQDSAKFKKIRKALLLSIAYSANIGGTATLTGTGTNLVLQEVFYSQFPKSHSLTFTTWFIYAFPSALVTIFAAWLILYILFARVHQDSQESQQRIRQSIQTKYDELGPFSLHQIGVLVHFVLLILLWFFRQPEIYPGWASLLTDDKKQIKDATPAILIAISMFIVPASIEQFYSDKEPSVIDKLLTWKVLQTKMSWGVVFLLGGGFALADGIEASGLGNWFSEQLKVVELSPFITQIILVALCASVTEVASNVATANVVLPVICQLALHLRVNPLLLLIPVTISISFAFMFPIATPPNAIVYEYLKINVLEMAIPGLMMNILAISIQLLSINTFGTLVFPDFKTFPDWAAAEINRTVLVAAQSL